MSDPADDALVQTAGKLREQLDGLVASGSKGCASARAAVDKIGPMVKALEGRVPPTLAVRIEALLTTLTLRSGALEAALRNLRQSGTAAVDALTRVPAAIAEVERSKRNLSETVDSIAAACKDVCTAADPADDAGAQAP